MKNFKKLFIALPLVLVMLFMALPVNAEMVNSCKVSANSIKQDLTLREVEWLTRCAQDECIPVWGAVQGLCNDRDGVARSGYIKLLNNGEPMTWITANRYAVSDLNLAQWIVENDDAFAGYAIPSYNINHVERIKTTIRVRADQVLGEERVSYIVKGNQQGLYGPDTNTKVIAPDAAGLVIDKQNNTVTYDAQGPNQQTVKVTPVFHEVTEKAVLTQDPADSTKFTVGADFHGLKAATKYTMEDINAMANLSFVLETGGKFAVVYKEQLVKEYTVNENIYKHLNGVVMDNYLDTLFTNKDGSFVVVDKVNVKVEKSPLGVRETYKWADLEGLLIVVEETVVPVTINHHYVLENGEEFIQTTEGLQEKNVELTNSNVKAEWLVQKEGFTYDPAKTMVKAVEENKQLTIGETFVSGWTVDLFYVAGENVDQDAIDAAFANTNAGVANANVANLPATGAASNVALILSSAALAVVGLFLKK